jgi:ribonuclease/clavin/mitogillin
VIRPRSVAPGVELFPARTPTLPPATHTNSYALQTSAGGSGDVLLVEPATPYEEERRAWIEWARGIASQGRTIIAIFATHHHTDHIGGLRVFAEALRVPVLAHAKTVARLKDLEGLEVRPVEDGADVFGWTALHTPGHAPGHLCLWNARARTLIAGDMVANGSTIIIPPDDDGDMAQYLEQLRRLDALSATLMLPAHGEPIDDPHALLTHYVKHRLERERKVLDAWNEAKTRLGRTPTLVELLPRAYDDTPVALWPLAKVSLEAHFVKLRSEGRVD